MISKYTIKKTLNAISLLWLGSLVGSGSTFLIYTILARKIGPELFGFFSSTLVTITIFTLLASFGVSQMWLKIFGKEGWDGMRWIYPSLKFVVISLISVTLLVLLFSLIYVHNVVLQRLLILLIFFVYGYVLVELVSSKLQLEERYSLLTFWQMLPNLSRLVVIASCYYIFSLSLSILNIGFIYAIIGFIFSVLSIIQLYGMKNGNFKLVGHMRGSSKDLKTPKIREVFIEAWPFGLGGLFAFIYVQSDIIMLKYLAGNEEVGYYNAAFTVLVVIYLLPSTLYQKFLMPKFHRWANSDKEKFYKVYKKGNIVMFVLGTFIMVFVIIFSKYFIPIIFGNDYNDSVGLINILAITLPFHLVSFSVASTLVTKDNMKKKVVYMGFVALINIILNICLIPIYQAIGAAIATVLSNIILLGIYYFATNKYVFNKTQ